MSETEEFLESVRQQEKSSASFLYMVISNIKALNSYECPPTARCRENIKEARRILKIWLKQNPTI